MAKPRKYQTPAAKAEAAKRKALVKALEAMGIDQDVMKAIVGSVSQVATPTVSSSNKKAAATPTKAKAYPHGTVDKTVVANVVGEVVTVAEIDKGSENDRTYVTRAAALKALFPTLKVELAGTWVWVSGATREFAEALGKKGQGLRFAGKKKQWYIAGKPSNNKRPAKMSWIRDKYSAEEMA